MKRLLATLLMVFAGLFVFSTTASAQVIETLITQSIAASGSLSASNSLSVTILANGTSFTSSLSFRDDLANGEVTITDTDAGIASLQVIQIDYDTNQVGFQAVIVSTDNRTLTNGLSYSGTGQGSGLVGETDGTVNVPLHWTVFDRDDAGVGNDPTGANAYVYAGDAASGNITNSNQLFVSDKQQAAGGGTEFNTQAVLGFASVIFGIFETTADMSNAPVDNGSGGNRSNTDGTVYMRFAADYKGQDAQGYRTETLTLELVTLT